MTDIPPTDHDYRPLRITGDQMRIGDVAWTLRNKQTGPGVVHAEARHDASGDDWVGMTVTFAGRAPDGLHGIMSIGDVPWLVRGWDKGPNGTRAEAGPVSDDEFEGFASRLGRTVRAG